MSTGNELQTCAKKTELTVRQLDSEDEDTALLRNVGKTIRQELSLSVPSEPQISVVQSNSSTSAWYAENTILNTFGVYTIWHCELNCVSGSMFYCDRDDETGKKIPCYLSKI